MPRRLLATALLSFCVLAACGCSGNCSVENPPSTPDFKLAVNPQSISLSAGTSKSLDVSLIALNGFTGQVDVSIGSLPSKVTVNTTSFVLSSGSQSPVKFSTSSTAAYTTATLTITGVAGAIKHDIRVPLAVANAAVADSGTVSAFGDSWSVCYKVPSANCWVNLVAADKGWTLTNLAAYATSANDPEQIGVIAPTVPSTGENYLWLCCINDMRNNLTPAQRQMWGQTVEAGLWMLSTQDSNKVWARAATLSGTWTTAPTDYTRILSTTTAGATMSATVFGTDVVGMSSWKVGDNSTYKWTVDGMTYPTEMTSTGSYTSIIAASNFGPTFFHRTGLAEAWHVVTLTCVSASSGNPCYGWLIGSSSRATTANGPWVYLGNTGHLLCPTGYNSTTSPGCGSTPCGSDAQVTLFDQMEQSIVDDLAAQNLNVIYVDINADGFYVPNGTNTQSDGIHPTAAGDALIANAFLSAMKDYSTPLDRSIGYGFRDGISIRSAHMTSSENQRSVLQKTSGGLAVTGLSTRTKTLSSNR
jgi:hypothetical protein